MRGCCKQSFKKSAVLLYGAPNLHRKLCIRGDSQIENRATRLPGGRAGGGDRRSGGFADFFFKNAKKNIRAVGSQTRGSPKCSKKVVFWHKNVVKIESGIHFFFPQKMFIPPTRLKRHFALKGTFPIETVVKKKWQTFPRIPKSC